MHVDVIKAELNSLVSESKTLRKSIGDSSKIESFGKRYQNWYSRALRIIATLAPDRLEEFQSYYEHDPKHRSTGVNYYRIQDYLLGFQPPMEIYPNPDWDVPGHVELIFQNQINILSSLSSRIEGVLANLAAMAYASIHDAELETAASLKKQSPRAAGALAGVLLESHLQRVASNRSVKLHKTRPTLSDLNDPLREAGVYDTTVWRKIQYLSDIRNLCSHKKNREPTSEEIDELLVGVNWALKNIN